MFTAGQDPPGDTEETQEYEAVALEGDDEEIIEAIEDESWEEDEAETWQDDDELDDWEEEAAGEEEAADVEQEESSFAGLGSWFRELRSRTRNLAAGALKRIGDIKLPRHEIEGQKALAVGGIVLVAVLVGTGGYLLGKGAGEDLDSARLEGEFAGKKAGAIAGATKGYAAGFRKGRDLAFRESYSASYRRNYRRAYENAGMDPPRAEDIEVPKP